MEALPRVTKVKVVRPYVLDLEFSDGTRREVDLGPEIQRGRIYDALKDPEFLPRLILMERPLPGPTALILRRSSYIMMPRIRQEDRCA
jgi:hypothetical protein